MSLVVREMVVDGHFAACADAGQQVTREPGDARAGGDDRRIALAEFEVDGLVGTCAAVELERLLPNWV
ncbi:MAG: hypothetical protein ACR2LX_01025 [Jatrophihabitans sp.]